MSRWKSRSNLVDPASCYRMKLKGRSGTCVSTYYTCTHGYGSLSSFMEAEGECCGCTYHVLSPAPICPYLERAQTYIYVVMDDDDGFDVPRGCGYYVQFSVFWHGWH